MATNQRAVTPDSKSPTGGGTKPDCVKKPSHYQIAPGIEAMDVISAVLTKLALPPQQSYLLGNLLKYRLRAGNKDNAQQDINKADEYARRLTALRTPKPLTYDVLLSGMRVHNHYRPGAMYPLRAKLV